MVTGEIYKLLYFLFIGICIGVLFDIFRIVRKCFKTSDFITYVHDIIFLVASGFILIFSIFLINNGEIRSYIFIGLIAGICIYLLTLSKYFISFLSKIILFIKKILFDPVIKLCMKIRENFSTFLEKIQKNKIKMPKIFSKCSKSDKIYNKFQ